MYCVIGSKVLRCEVREKCEGYSWCKIGDAPKNKSIPHNKLFHTEEEARAYIQKRDHKKSVFVADISLEADKCVALYDTFEKETGIKVRLIDRKWTVNDVQKHIKQLKKASTKR